MFSRYRLTKFYVLIFGKRIYCWLQEKLKFLLNFRKEYSLFAPKIHQDKKKKLIVFNIDGKTSHGGLSDRFRGLFAAYYYAQKIGAEFKVIWNHPFRLEDYLVPNVFDWRIDEKDLSHNFFEVGFRFQNDYSRIANDEVTFMKLMKSNKPELHVYINTTIREDLYCSFFQDLFSPSETLKTAIDSHLLLLGGVKQYVSMSFRFIGILGDFQDHDASRSMVKNESEKLAYIELCLHALKVVHSINIGKKILVTTDSPIFLNEASQLPYVYTIPGQIDHIDTSNQKNEDVYLKTFLDFMMIVNASKNYVYSTGRMFGNTKFAKTASLSGGNEFIFLNDIDVYTIEKTN